MAASRAASSIPDRAPIQCHPGLAGTGQVRILVPNTREPVIDLRPAVSDTVRRAIPRYAQAVQPAGIQPT
jgi:hypothetical protein